MRTIALVLALAIVAAGAEESRIRIGAVDAVLTVPDGVEQPPVALLIAERARPTMTATARASSQRR